MKIAHLADLHLGYRAYTRTDEKGINLREKDVLIAFKNALFSVPEDVKLIIIAGDIFHQVRPSNKTLEVTIKILKDFRECSEIPILITCGNHEMSKAAEMGNALRVIESAVDDITIIDTDITTVCYPDIEVLAVPYSCIPQLKDYDYPVVSKAKYKVMSIHGSFNSDKCPELSQHSSCELLDANNLNAAKFDYIAIGHYHKYTELASNIFYSGSIERASTNIWDEKSPKGFIIYDLEAKTHEFIRIKTRPVIDLPKINADLLTVEQLNERIKNLLSGIPNLSESIVRLNIDNLSFSTQRQIDQKMLREFAKTAVHLKLNFTKKEVIETTLEGQRNTKTIESFLDDELKSLDLPSEISKDEFSQVAKKYLQEAEAN